MNKKLLAPLVLLSLIPPLAGRANDIEPGKEFYTAPYTINPITIDGQVDEWAGVSVLADPRFAIPKGSGASGTYVLFEEYNGGKWTGPSDQTSAVQITYDAENIYFAFVVTDDYHENAANSAWDGDSVQLMIANGDRTQQVALYNYSLGGIEEALGDSTIIMHEAGPGGTEAVVRRDTEANKTYYEIKLPAASMGLTSLAPGIKFGLGMAINDGDQDTPGQKGWGGLGAHALVFGKSPGETALVTLGANETTTEILGTGTTALLGGDLTDPENDGDELAGPTSETWNWKAITGNNEPTFNGGEASFNIFDNQVGGGNAKWCCDDPTEANPFWVAVEFENAVSLTHFTVTSGNDAPDRDPTNWQIQGSNDGTTFTPIYSFDEDTALWTARDQVIKFTLPSPSAPYRHIRYIVYETPGTLHQLNEIEYFGTFGGTSTAYFSAVQPGLTGFTFNANDVGASIIVPSTAKLRIDNQEVALTNTKDGGLSSFTYAATSPFLPGSSHTYEITVKDAQGNTITTTGNFRTQAYGLLTAADKVTADTSKPGFIFRVHQNNAFTDGTIARTEMQLAGLLGANMADPAVIGPALAEGVPGPTSAHPLTYEIPTVINVDQEFGSTGDFVPDDQMPGIPGLGAAGQTDGIAAEIITYVELPAGQHRFLMTSDDGYRTTVGNVNDVFKAQTAGEFIGVAVDHTIVIYAQEAGIYPLRTVWYEGGGGAYIEWKTLTEDGTEVLLNDTANGGYATYRAATGLATAIKSVTPLIGQAGVEADTSIAATILEGSQAVDVSSVKLTLNGTALGATATKSGNLVSISFKPTTLFPARSTNDVTLTYTAGGVARTESWKFVVNDYKVLTPNLRVTADTSKPGFIWNVHQNPALTATDNIRPVQQLAGLLGENFADPAAIGAAVAEGTPGANNRMPIMFEIERVINLDQGFGSFGEFTPDEQMPGIPGLSAAAPTDGIAAEIITYINLPAGKTTLIVNSDDGFRTLAGNVSDLFQGMVLGEFVGGRGAADTSYSFFVEQAGIYPFKTIWYEGGGDANIEWKLVKADGTRVLLNDRDNGGPATYRAITGGGITAITRVSPTIGETKALANGVIEVDITEGATTVDTASVKFDIDGTVVTPTVTRVGKVLTARFTPTTSLTAGSHTVGVMFTHGGTARENEWTFTVPPVTLDTINNRPALILGAAKRTAAGAGHTGGANDYAIDFGNGTGTPSVLIPDASFVNATAAEDQMTFSFWAKKYDNANNSAFWADSPSSASAQRGFQAHLPWSDGNVYFDSAGCCDAGLTRINQPVNETTVEDYTAPTWWNDWHHWAFVKNGGSKQIWVDGKLFLDGSGDPLPSDFERIWLGAEGGGAQAGIVNQFHGQMDDFAVFGTGLAEEDIVKLANGTLPTALAASAKPLAFWNFNDASVPVTPPSLGITRTANSITITWPATAAGFVLQSADDVDGPWTPVAGVTGNSHTINNPTGVKFYRLVQ
ncbi:MAG: discoidin domain-containing protein [Verrucomicrobiales bacterium]